jgi:hypothetical protein
VSGSVLVKCTESPAPDKRPLMSLGSVMAWVARMRSKMGGDDRDLRAALQPIITDFRQMLLFSTAVTSSNEAKSVKLLFLGRGETYS